VWSSGIVGLVFLLGDEPVPSIAVSVESAGAVAVDEHPVAAEDECRRLVLVSNLQRVVEPVLDVCTPLRQVM
jgi:hypothetical protein